MQDSDASWSEPAVYACPCGATYPVTYWRWVDVIARPDLAERVAASGPFEGKCPSCHATPTAMATWLSVDPGAETATLVLSADQRGDVIGELQRHLDSLRRRSEAVQMYLVRPRIEFAMRSTEEETGRRPIPTRPSEQPPVPVQAMRSGEMVIDMPSPSRGAPISDIPVRRTARQSSPATGVPSMPPGVPQLIGSDLRTPGTVAAQSLGAFVGEVVIDNGDAVLRASVTGAGALKWRDANINGRPIHLRGNGYPLVGVRLVGAYMGQVGVLDGFIDVGDPDATAVFRALAQRFVVKLELDVAGEEIAREVVGEGLEPNAALCLESARGLLAHGEYPPQDFDKAKAAVAETGVGERLQPTKVTIAPSAYMHVVGGSEASAALEHLSRVSRKEYLSRLLEVDGLPMGEYDAIRRRVLAGSLEHGLVAPRRFWRRVVASGLVADLRSYAAELSTNRAAHVGEEGDLDPDAARQAWEGILDLCQRKNIPPPPELRDALDLPEGGPPPAPGQKSAAGEIGATDDSGLAAQLRDPQHRLKAATDVLQGRTPQGDLTMVMDALDEFDTDELLAILPDLSELGPRAVPGLIPKLGSDRREVRQAAAILLGMALDPDALEPLSECLVGEDTNVWLDVARSLGSFGPVAVRRLCQILRREAGSERESRAVERVARALAEIALSDGDVAHGDPRPAHDAVAALADAGDPRVGAAARRALATLSDVSESGAAIRGERPLSEVTEVRGFSRRAYEAILVPELEVEAEA